MKIFIRTKFIFSRISCQISIRYDRSIYHTGISVFGFGASYRYMHIQLGQAVTKETVTSGQKIVYSSRTQIYNCNNTISPWFSTFSEVLGKELPALLYSFTAEEWIGTYGHATDPQLKQYPDQACRNSELLESGIPARCDICRQFGPYLQTDHVYCIFVDNFIIKPKLHEEMESS